MKNYFGIVIQNKMQKSSALRIYFICRYITLSIFLFNNIMRNHWIKERFLTVTLKCVFNKPTDGLRSKYSYGFKYCQIKIRNLRTNYVIWVMIFHTHVKIACSINKCIRKTIFETCCVKVPNNFLRNNIISVLILCFQIIPIYGSSVNPQITCNIEVRFFGKLNISI